MIELGPVVGVHVKVRQRSFANIDSVPDPRLPCFLGAPASGPVVQLPRHILPHLYIRISLDEKRGRLCVEPRGVLDWEPLNGTLANPGSQPCGFQIDRFQQRLMQCIPVVVRILLILFTAATLVFLSLVPMVVP